MNYTFAISARALSRHRACRGVRARRFPFRRSLLWYL